ncbi:hypothetical protein BH09ACT10_BH09ACT10_00030 [soil metagenome]
MPHNATTITDPVCGMHVDPANAVAHTLHDNYTYHFCSQHCADSFAADPARYTGK